MVGRGRTPSLTPSIKSLSIDGVAVVDGTPSGTSSVESLSLIITSPDGPMPVGNKFLRRNPVLLWLERQGFYQAGTFPLGSFVAKCMRDGIKRFGAGNHSYLGKNISAREMYKLVPSLTRTTVGLCVRGSLYSAIRYHAFWACRPCFPHMQLAIQEGYWLWTNSSLETYVRYAFVMRWRLFSVNRVPHVMWTFKCPV